MNLSNWRVQDQLRKRQVPSAPPPGRAREESGDDASRTATVERIPDPAGAEVETVWDREWQMTFSDGAWAKVKAQCDLKHWQIFDLYVLKEWSVGEVTKALGISAGRRFAAGGPRD